MSKLRKIAKTAKSTKIAKITKIEKFAKDGKKNKQNIGKLRGETKIAKNTAVPPCRRAARGVRRNGKHKKFVWQQRVTVRWDS